MFSPYPWLNHSHAWIKMYFNSVFANAPQVLLCGHSDQMVEGE